MRHEVIETMLVITGTDRAWAGTTGRPGPWGTCWGPSVTGRGREEAMVEDAAVEEEEDMAGLRPHSSRMEPSLPFWQEQPWPSTSSTQLSPWRAQEEEEKREVSSMALMMMMMTMIYCLKVLRN